LLLTSSHWVLLLPWLGTVTDAIVEVTHCIRVDIPAHTVRHFNSYAHHSGVQLKLVRSAAAALDHLISQSHLLGILGLCFDLNGSYGTTRAMGGEQHSAATDRQQQQQLGGG
jgi:hypothetical protein